MASMSALERGARAFPHHTALILAEANRIVQGALKRAREINIRISAAVCDAGGRVIAFNRVDGAIWASVNGSQRKAIASVGFARPSGEVWRTSP